MKPVVYERQALKALRKMPANTAALIQSKVQKLAQGPGSLVNNSKPLKGQPGTFRLRVGDWRVIYRDGVVIEVMRIGPRGPVYE